MAKRTGGSGTGWTSMEMYQHDSSSEFRFVLRGSLEGPWVQELEHAWITAASILKGKELVIDGSGLTGIDENGLKLLSRIRDAGGRFTADSPPEQPSVPSRWSLRSLSVLRSMRQRGRA